MTAAFAPSEPLKVVLSSVRITAALAPKEPLMLLPIWAELLTIELPSWFFILPDNIKLPDTVKSNALILSLFTYKYYFSNSSILF
jgi:hypothetical protein